MTTRYVVVDGSNIATEGRSIPSLAQLDEAVRAFMVEHPTDQVIVVVDASFGYRIDESERKEYDQAEAAGEIVSPPAGAVGRGDGFLLRIADRTDAVVLSNDSFQEFHAEYRWLFHEGRLIGGKPVPGVGWIFTPRSPVRGPRSREVMRAQKKAEKAALKRAPVADGPVADAIATATAEAIAPDRDEADGGNEMEPGEGTKGGKRTRRRRAKPADTINDPLPFIEFIAEHPLGTEVEGDVETFTSHGAFVKAGGARCYVPLVALGDPPPRSAKTVLKRGEPRVFVVQALDPPRRGIELALPGLARVAGTPTEETVEAEISAGRKARAPKAAEPEPAPVTGVASEEPAPKPAKRGRKAIKETPAPEPEVAPEKPAKARRAKKAADAVRVVEPEAAPPAPAPAKARRSKKAEKPAEPEAAPVPARSRRTQKAAPERPADGAQPAGEPAPAKARRSRNVAAVAAVAVEPAPEPEPEPVKKAARRARKAAAEAEPAQEKKPARKRAAAKKAAGGEPAAEAPAKRRSRSET
ncbi:MAG: NYN domain-containing protein [Acidimicrobiales bacterium]